MEAAHAGAVASEAMDDRDECREGAAVAASAECLALLRLVSAHGVGPVAVSRLLRTFGSGRAALHAPAMAWADALECAPGRAERCRESAWRASIGEQCRAGIQIGARLVGRGDAEYPALLAAIPDPPPVLWLQGTLQSIDDWSVAMVGARRCTAYGIDQTARITRGLVEHGHTIVSGGARGIDAEAHRAALRAGGRTIAILGSGLACPYPPEHRELFRQIAGGNGAVVSEHPPTTEPRSAYFPRRNRIIAGMSLAVVLVEARSRSGASITARLAVEDLGREVMALPGRVDQPTSEGTHRAIREGWAALVSSPAEVIEHLRQHGAPRNLLRGARAMCAVDPQGGGDVLTPTARRLGETLAARGPLALSQLVTDEEAGAFLAELTLLELAGMVRRDAEGRWEARDALLQRVRSQPSSAQAIRGP